MMLVQLFEDEFYKDTGPWRNWSMKVLNQPAIWTRAGTHEYFAARPAGSQQLRDISVKEKKILKKCGVKTTEFEINLVK